MKFTGLKNQFVCNFLNFNLLHVNNGRKSSNTNHRKPIIAIPQFKSANKALFDPFNPMSAIFAEAKDVTTHGTDDEVCDLLYDLFVYGASDETIHDGKKDDSDDDNFTKLLLSAFDHGSSGVNAVNDDDMEQILPLIFWRFHPNHGQYSPTQLQSIDSKLAKQGFQPDAPHAFFVSRVRLYCSIIFMLKSYLITHVSMSKDPETDYISQLLSYSLFLLKYIVENQVPYSSTNDKARLAVSPKESGILGFAAGLLFSRYFKANYGASVFTHGYSHVEFVPQIVSRIHSSGMIIGHNSVTTGSQYLQPTHINQKLLTTYKQLLTSVIMSTTHTLSSCPWPVLLSLSYFSILFNHKLRAIKVITSLLSKALPPQTVMNDKDFNDDTKAIISELGCHPQLGFMLAHLDISCGGKLKEHLSPRLLFVLERLFKLQSNSLRVAKSPPNCDISSSSSSLLARQSQSDKLHSNSTSPIPGLSLRSSLFQTQNISLVEGDYLISSTLSAKYKDSASYSALFKPIGDYLAEGGITAPFVSPLNPSVSSAGHCGDSTQTVDITPPHSDNITVPALSISVKHSIDGTIVTIAHSNLQLDKELILNIHYTDTELLLSHHPFANEGSSSTQHSMIVKPHLSFTLAVGQPTGQLECSLPPQLSVNSQLTVIAPQSNLSVVCPLFYTAFNVVVSNQLNNTNVKAINATTSPTIPQFTLQLVTKSSNTPLSGAYIKCFVQKEYEEGSQFLCDGYTSLSGKASFNPYAHGGPQESQIYSYAIVISHLVLGTTVVYLSTPPLPQ